MIKKERRQTVYIGKNYVPQLEKVTNLHTQDVSVFAIN
jgi:hypothetical protein